MIFNKIADAKSDLSGLNKCSTLWYPKQMKKKTHCPGTSDNIKNEISKIISANIHNGSAGALLAASRIVEYLRDVGVLKRNK